MLRLLAAVCLVGCAIAFPEGAPEGACGSLTPNHGALPQENNSNYELSVIGSPGGQYTVTLKPKIGTFKGFMIQAFDASGNAVGTFTLSDNVKTQLICSNTGVTHTSQSNNLRGVEVYWTGPIPVQFRATVVEAYNTFYQNILSEVVQA